MSKHDTISILGMTKKGEPDLFGGGVQKSEAETVVAATPIWVVAGLAMGPAIAQGFARFAYALLLPSMRADLHWNYADAGLINTANAAGYLGGAIGTTAVAKRIGMKQSFALGALLTVASVACSGLTSNFAVLIVLRLIAGAAGALTFVTGGALAAAASTGGGASRAPLFLGLYFSGAGFGVLVSAFSVPPLLAMAGWRAGWYSLGAFGLLAFLAALPALRIAPVPAVRAASTEVQKGGWSAKFMAWTLIAYTLFGAGYIAYATFVVAYLRTAQGFTSSEISAFWALLGGSAIFGAFAWGPVLAKLRGGWGSSATLAVVTVGALLPLLSNDRPFAYISAFLFGASFLSVAAAVTSFARSATPPHAWTTAIGVLTAVFGIGQCVGPVLSGALSDGPIGLRAGLMLSVGILALSAVAAAFQPAHDKDKP